MLHNRQTRLAVVSAGVALMIGLVVSVATSASAATLFSDDFNDGNANGWTTSGGTWSVVTDGTGVYRQSGTSGDARARAGQSSWTNYSVTARVKPTAVNGTNRFAAVLARTQSATSYYYVALRSNNTVELKKLVNGTGTTLASAPITFSLNTWYTLRLEVNGTTLRSTVNGGTALQATDTQYVAGGIGVATFNATANFDDVIVDTGTTSTTPPPTTPPPTSPVPSGTLFVATNGSDSNPGTQTQPLLTIQRAHDLVQAGGTIAVRGGTYRPSVTIKITKNGSSSQPITLTNFNNERVIIDGENMPFTPGAVDSTIPRADRGALHVEGDWWRFIGLEIINGPYGIFGVDTNNGRYERLITHDNYESGLHLQGASAGNQIINLDSFNNRDPRNNGESADGLAIKEGSGSGNVVRGARLWFNSDDGFDAWEFLSPITIENSVAYGNGFNRWNIPNYSGDGNGFKLGGGDVDMPAAHVTRNSMAWDNSAGGFIDNGNPGALLLDHNTAWSNDGTGFDAADSSGTLTRNLSVGNGTNQSLGSASNSNNSWNLGGTWTFVSTDSSTITGPRNTDGTIRTSNFLRPSNGADVGARI
jgi:hypothetical protein